MSILLSAAFLAALVPQDPKPGRLVLPANAKAPAKPKAAVPELDELQRFHKDVLPLRRTVHLSQSAEALLLTKLSVDFGEPGKLALELLPKVGDDEAHGLMKVLVRYPSAEAGQHLHYLLLTRAFGEATPMVLDTMVKLLGEQAKSALFDCITAKFSGVRQAATDRLLAHVDAGDLPRLDAL